PRHGFLQPAVELLGSTRLRRRVVEQLRADVMDREPNAVATLKRDPRCQVVIAPWDEVGIAREDQRVVPAGGAGEVISMLADPRSDLAVVETGAHLDVEVDSAVYPLQDAEQLPMGIAGSTLAHREAVQQPRL